MKHRIAFTGMACLIVAMGFGRFALTPQLPHMINEGQITLTQASWLAAANFLGYLLGAIETIQAKRHLILRLKCGLWGSAVILLLTAFMPTGAAGFYVNLLLRFTAGIASAWTLVLISTWFQKHLRDEHTLRTYAFAGPAVGIFITGIIALGLDYGHASAALNWFVYGVVALCASWIIHKNLPSALPETPKDESFHLNGSMYRLGFSYLLYGLAYILPATFLSKLAKDQFSNALVADLFWPLFGLSAVMGMLFLSAQKNIKRPERWLAATFCIQGIGILACSMWSGVGGLLIGALLVGGSFMVTMQLTFRLGVQLSPHHLQSMTGLLTTGFAVGQLIGPLLSGVSTFLWSSMLPALLAAVFGSFLAAVLVYSIYFGGSINESQG